MKLRILSAIILLLMIVNASLANEIPAREKFLEQASLIHQEAAEAFANSLTDADWYEVDLETLLKSFQTVIDSRERFAWGHAYDDDIWLQYVVPDRADDEPLQPYRTYFIEEMGQRLDTLSTLARAAIEVNIFLGEHIGFKSTDWRDQGPLTSISCGYGRCGEMMIAAISAMRSVGIPARGVYVPFWSAYDNNHAWIEVYTEDGWKYMGACEPSTRLNDAWFNESVFRAGILLTKDRTYSDDNPDAVKTSGGNALNVTRNYVPPAKLIVEMPRKWGKKDRLWFALFNFGTIRPLVELTPKKNIAQLEVGHGDFVLYGIYKGKLFFQPFTAQIERETRVVLDVNKTAPQDFTLTYPWPPLDGIKDPELIPRYRIDKGNVLRQKRNAEREWSSDWLQRFVTEEGGIYDKLFETLKRAPGNEAAVMNAVLDAPEEQRETAIFIVSGLSDKDLRDARYETLKEWVLRTPGKYADSEDLKPFVLDPQIGYEYPGTGLPASYKTETLVYTDLDVLKKDVKVYSKQVDEDKRQRPLPPVTIDNMLADGLSISASSAAIWWTDRLRRAGIPARCQPFSNWLEFYFNGEWLPLIPDDPGKLGKQDAVEEVSAHYKEPAIVTVKWKEATSAPAWESEFLMMPIKDNGLPDFRSNPQDLKDEETNTIVTLSPGEYLLTAGRRNGRGDVAVKTDMISLEEGQHLTIELDLVPPPEPPSASGMKMQLADLQWQPENLDKMNMLIVLGDNEPSKRTKTQALEFKSDRIAVNFVDSLEKVPEADRETLGLSERDASGAPYVFFFDENGKLLFTQAGYDLNLPSRIRNALR